MNLAFTGVWMLRVAQGWLVLQLTGSGVALGVVYALMYLPMLLVGSWSGVIADRYPKRQILYCTASAMGAVAALLGLLDIAGVVQLWEVYVLRSGLIGHARRVTTARTAPKGHMAPSFFGADSLVDRGSD